MNDPNSTQAGWQFFALGSAFFAALTAILGKMGVAEINSNLATFIRTIVILVVTAALLFLRNEWESINKLSKFGLTMLVLSGVATGASWLCYYRALQMAPASQVAPVDKLSVALVIILSLLFLGEQLTCKLVLGGTMVVVGVVIIATSKS